MRDVIEDLFAEFAFALDRQRYALLEKVFTVSARYESGRRRFSGMQAIIESFEGRQGVRTTRHVWSALRWAQHEGQVRCTSTWTCFAANTVAPIEPVSIYMVADFADVLVQAPEGWRISTRLVHPVFRNAEYAPDAVSMPSFS